ncbi:hypothetical protein K0M31_001085 [Melipona bicolor]|uniref:Uncharacterized protein n=1 Tax=Melipona bicolor TaxID=60889 RepID=A0AA40KXB6_9HYME|nr:hypothetical protein K0M31_001085 [Melipona bicolor]
MKLMEKDRKKKRNRIMIQTHVFRKVAGERRDELRWERDLDRNIRSRATSPDRHQVDRGRATSPQRVVPSSVAAEPPDVPLNADEEEERRRHVRRPSSTVRRMTRQRSYDDEMKSVAAMSGGGGQHAHPEPGLGLPVQLPRRASAYDVYATPGAGGLNAMAIAAAQQRASISAQGGRKPEERPTVRRSSFRAVKPVMPYEVGAEDESMMNLEASPVPVVPPKVVPPPVLGPDEERRTRRRGSQL